MHSTIYFFAGSAVCVKVIPVFAVMSSSCGIGRPLHLAAFAPAGGGGGSGWPPCAPARRAARSKTVKTFADFLQRFLFKGFSHGKNITGEETIAAPRSFLTSTDLAHSQKLREPCGRILVSLDSTHAPAPDSHRSDFIALPAAPGGRSRIARRSCIPPSHPPRAHARSHPRSRRFLRRHWLDPRGFRGASHRWSRTSRLE